MNSHFEVEKILNGPSEGIKNLIERNEKSKKHSWDITYIQFLKDKLEEKILEERKIKIEKLKKIINNNNENKK
jgi:hypothetical protein